MNLFYHQAEEKMRQTRADELYFSEPFQWILLRLVFVLTEHSRPRGRKSSYRLCRSWTRGRRGLVAAGWVMKKKKCDSLQSWVERCTPSAGWRRVWTCLTCSSMNTHQVTQQVKHICHSWTSPETLYHSAIKQRKWFPQGIYELLMSWWTQTAAQTCFYLVSI